MNKYFVWLIVAGFGAWIYNQHQKEKKRTNPKLK
jgi:hypothetical protein